MKDKDKGSGEVGGRFAQQLAILAAGLGSMAEGENSLIKCVLGKLTRAREEAGA